MTRFFRLVVALFALGAFAASGAPAPAQARPSCCGSSCPMPKKPLSSKCCHIAPAAEKTVVLVSAPAAIAASSAAALPVPLSVSAAVAPYAPRAPSPVLVLASSGLSPPAALA